MLKVVIMSMLVFGATPEDVYDPSSIDFCSLKCGENQNTACKCVLKGRIKEDLHHLVEFRKRILDVFNTVRNDVAAGKVPVAYFHQQQASNINVLSYDLELEHLARCYANRYVFGNDLCRKTSRFDSPGQILIRFRKKKKNLTNLVNRITQMLTNVMKHVSNTTIDWYGGYDSGINHEHIHEFTEVVWWSHTHVGCARIDNVDAILSRDSHVIICNFAGSQPSNVVGKSVFNRGIPCTKCKCNKLYEWLCGEMQPIPEEKVQPITKSGSEVGGTVAIFILCLNFCFVQLI